MFLSITLIIIFFKFLNLRKSGLFLFRVLYIYIYIWRCFLQLRCSEEWSGRWVSKGSEGTRKLPWGDLGHLTVTCPEGPSKIRKIISENFARTPDGLFPPWCGVCVCVCVYVCVCVCVFCVCVCVVCVCVVCVCVCVCVCVFCVCVSQSDGIPIRWLCPGSVTFAQMPIQMLQPNIRLLTLPCLVMSRWPFVQQCRFVLPSLITHMAPWQARTWVHGSACTRTEAWSLILPNAAKLSDDVGFNPSTQRHYQSHGVSIIITVIIIVIIIIYTCIKATR
jgi:hypothetical protein